MSTISPNDQALDDLVRAGGHLSQEMEFERLMPILLDQAMDISRSDLTCIYLHTDPGSPESPLRKVAQRGSFQVAERLLPEEEWIAFIQESEEAVLLLERKRSPFAGLLLHPAMESGIALPLVTAAAKLGLVVLNSREPNYYGRQKFRFLDSFIKLAGGLLHNARLFQELKEYLARIEALERYQSNIFSSMTNLLVTTDRQGKLRYFNQKAGERLGLNDGHIGRHLKELWDHTIDAKILEAIQNSQSKSQEMLGVEGIFRNQAVELDFSLNVSPMKATRDAPRELQGATLVFTDQTREKELQGEVEVVVEERRVVKDMFARYLSNDIMQVLMDSPETVKLGGETKQATVLFADIRGYTSFAEGREPSTIIKILNEYFTEAVDIIIQQGGYIDKFIGDAIMAAWGVPISRGAEETSNAVAAAISIQALVASKTRKFFRGEADGLKIGIGMHTGPLVAGNLGSAQRMDYTVIGDTVNIAARLEGVAKGGEVIITESTRLFLGDGFHLEKREPVMVKGKSKPIPIYSVLSKYA